MTLQGVGAVVAGFVGMAVVVMLGTPLVSKVGGAMPDGRTFTTPRLLADFVLGMIAAAAGGAITAKLAPADPFAHGLALSGLVLLMSLYCLVAITDETPPRWYQALLTLSSVAVVLAVGRFLAQSQ